jgi:hypothetical protein
LKNNKTIKAKKPAKMGKKALIPWKRLRKFEKSNF